MIESSVLEDAWGAIPESVTLSRHGRDAYLVAHGPRIRATVAAEEIAWRKAGRSNDRMLIIGGWPGLTALYWAKRARRITYLDHPSAVNDELRECLVAHGIELHLRDVASDGLGGINAQFNVAECCACMEHWNTNPVPIVRDIIESLTVSGVFYVQVPNEYSLYRRLQILMGRSITVTADDFYAAHIAGRPDGTFHWHEYTLSDLSFLMELSGGRVASKGYGYYSRGDKRGLERTVYNFAVRLLPALRDDIWLMVERGAAQSNDGS